MSFWEDDLDTFFSDFAVTALVGTVSETPVQVLFDEDAKDYSSGAGVVTATGPQIKVKASDVEAYSIKKGDAVYVDGRNWTITSPARIHSTGIKIFKLQVA